MIRGITKEEDELKQKRILRLRKLIRAAWIVTIFVLVIGIFLVFLDYERPGTTTTPRNSFAVVINRESRERPAVHGTLVRLVAGRAYVLTVAGGVIKQADLGKSVEIWFPWLPRDRTIPATVKIIHQTRSSPPGPGYSPYLALVEFEAPPEVRLIEITTQSLESLGNTSLEVWGVDMRSFKVTRLSGRQFISKIYSDGYFSVPIGAGDYPYGAAVVAKGRLAGVIADMASGKSAGAGEQAVGIGALEIHAAITKVVGR